MRRRSGASVYVSKAPQNVQDELYRIESAEEGDDGTSEHRLRVRPSESPTVSFGRRNSANKDDKDHSVFGPYLEKREEPIGRLRKPVPLWLRVSNRE